MTDIPNLAFEAQLWSATHRINAKKEDKTVIVMHVHPSEAAQLMDSDLLGKRFQCVLVAIGDDEQPEKVGGEVAEQEPAPGQAPPELQDVLADALKKTVTFATPVGSKERRAFHDLPRVTQAGILNGDKEFWAMMQDIEDIPIGSPEMCAFAVRRHCGVGSRRELDTNNKAAARWDFLYATFQERSGQMAEIRG